MIGLPYVRKSKRVGRFRFNRESRRGQEAFIIIVVVILVLVLLAVLATIWIMPGQGGDERGVTRVSHLPEPPTSPGIRAIALRPASVPCTVAQVG